MLESEVPVVVGSAHCHLSSLFDFHCYIILPTRLFISLL